MRWAATRAAAEQSTARYNASYRRDLVPISRQTSITVWRQTPSSH